jgi:transcription elongation GreA/GreB family factor
VFICTSVPEEIYLNYREHLEKEAANNRGAVFFAYLAYCKAVSEENNTERIAVLNALSKNSSAEKNNMLQNKSSGFVFGKVVHDVLVEAFGEDKVAAPFQFAGFNIDILFDSKVDGAPKLAIECDGSKKHDQREAYLHDLHRKKILEKGGFVFLRIWSVNWWRNPEREKAKLIAYINEIAQKRLSEGDQPFEHSFVRAKIHSAMVEVPVLTKVVKLNSVVLVKYMELNKVITVQIVNHVVKNELKESVQKISIESPLAISLLGNREGDMVKIGNLDNFVEIIKID